MLLCVAVALLCASAPALGQVNCGNILVQAAWLDENTNVTTCIAPLSSLGSNAEFSPDNAERVRMVCTDVCGEAFVDWLRGPECSGQSEAELVAFGVADIICSSSNDSERAESSCIFSNSTGRVDDALIGSILQNCSERFLDTSQMCLTDCKMALQSAIDIIGCCYNNFYGTEIAVEMVTEEFIDFLNQTNSGTASQLPSNFTVNITDSALLEACNIINPGICKPVYAETEGGVGVTMTASLAVLITSLLSALTIH